MKSLLALLLLGLGLGFGYWKTQYPDATVNDLTTGANEGINRVKSGFASTFDGGAAENALNSRLETIESDLLETKRVADPTETISRIEESNSRIDSLEAAIIATQQAADPAVINGRLTDAERRMTASDANQDTFNSELSTSVESIQTGIDATDAQVSALDGKLDLLDRRIEEQAQQFNADGINAALAKLDASISSLQEDLSRTDTEQNVNLSGMNEKLSSFEARLNTLSADASNGQAETVASINGQIDQRIATMESKLNTTNADSLRLESMANELSASRVKMQAMEQSVSETNEQLAELLSQIDTLKTQSESTSIDGQQMQLQTQLKQLQDQINESSGNADVAALTDALQASRDRIQVLEQRVVDLPPSSSAANDATQIQSALQAQIEALQSKLSDIENAPDPKLANSISQVEEKVSELAAKGYVTQEELAEQQQARSVEYKIYFERNSTEITEDAGAVLNSFIAQEKNRTTGVSIYGFTDRRGPAIYNQALALQRATNVRSYLIQNGFSYTKIRSLSGLGEDASVNLPDDQEDAQQRAVVLYAQQP